MTLVQARLFVYSFVLINFSDVIRGKQWNWHIHKFIFLMYCETLLIIFQIYSESENDREAKDAIKREGILSHLMRVLALKLFLCSLTILKNIITNCSYLY